MHIDHKAGEKLAIVDRTSGEMLPVEVFVAILGASQLLYVEIYHKNERIALYPRNRLKYKNTTVSEHMPPQHRYRDDWSAERFISWAESIDGDVKTFIERVLASRAPRAGIQKLHGNTSSCSCLRQYEAG